MCGHVRLVPRAHSFFFNVASCFLACNIDNLGMGPGDEAMVMCIYTYSKIPKLSKSCSH